jgi:hypothetical protein
MGKISEVAPPEIFQQLRSRLEQYQPQVAIVSPRPDEMLKDNTVSVKLQVKDLPLFKDERLGLGPHLHVFLDEQPYQAVYDVSEPLVLKDLQPGTHTLRVFAERPWHESFKNDGAYAQTTFHVFTKSPENNPNPDLPLLTYSRPQGSYGAEPILLDFFLANAPLHFVAEEDSETADWRIRVTVNGSSFVIDRWQPIYLKGFNPGKNWVQLEYIDASGNIIQNVYNTTARVITYEPNGSDALSRLVRGEVPLEEAQGIVDPTYKYVPPAPPPQPEAPPEPTVTPTPEPLKTPEPAPVVPLKPATPQPVEPQPVVPEVPAIAPTEQKPQEKLFDRIRRALPKSESPGEPAANPLDRFRKLLPKPDPSVAPVEVVPEAAPAAIDTPEVTPEVPTPEPVAPKENPFDRFRKLLPKPSPSVAPSPVPEPTPEVVPPVIETPEPAPIEPQPSFFDRVRQAIPKPAPSVAPVAAPPEVEIPAEVIEPAPVEPIEPAENPFNRFRRSLPKPTPRVAPVEPAPSVAPEPDPAIAPQVSPFNRFRRSIPQPTLIPEAAEPAEIPSPEPPEPDGRSELEKRLGVKITPVVPPASPPKPQPPAQFQRTSAIPTPESSPVKLPETLEAPDPVP